MRRAATTGIVACLVGAGLARAKTITPQGSLQLWVRAPGAYHTPSPPKPERQKTIALAAVPEKARQLVTHLDLQYRQKDRFQALPLAAVVRAYGTKGLPDTAILHFSGGIQLPVPTTMVLNAGRGLMVAYAIHRGGKWQQKFPPLTKPDEFYRRDPNPIVFRDDNKILATEGFLQSLKKATMPVLVAWRRTDSLTGIEFVDFAAYQRQFLPRKASTAGKKGWLVFRQRCMACHSVRRVGARFGWDYVVPLPAYKQRNPTSLLFHAKLRKFDSFARGLLMPPQKDFTKPQAQALWVWMKEVATQGQHPYKP